MNRFLPAAVLSLLISFAMPLAAQNSPVVVELYTSQGCSSCPPADKILHALAEREDVIALALHVDYWDYIGWEDPFGDPAHSERQRAYARAGGRHSVRTPEMIVQGETDIEGHKPMKLSEAIAAHAARAPQVALELTREGEDVLIEAETLADLRGPFSVHVLSYTPLFKTEIKRGENRGKILQNANVVEGWKVLAEWDGTAPLSLRAQMPDDKPCVVIIQHANAGPILAAARVR